LTVLFLSFLIRSGRADCTLPLCWSLLEYAIRRPVAMIPPSAAPPGA
jgi:hypothetical protein